MLILGAVEELELPVGGGTIRVEYDLVHRPNMVHTWRSARNAAVAHTAGPLIADRGGAGCERTTGGGSTASSLLSREACCDAAVLETRGGAGTRHTTMMHYLDAQVLILAREASREAAGHIHPTSTGTNSRGAISTSRTAAAFGRVHFFVIQAQIYNLLIRRKIELFR